MKISTTFSGPIAVSAALVVLFSADGGFAQSDPYGGSGGHFLVVQELPGSETGTPGRCANHLLPVAPVVEGIRDARLVAPVTDRTQGTLDFDAAAAGEVIGEISVCYRATTRDREYEAVAVLELETGDHRLLLEASGLCKDYPVPLNAAVLYQSCSLQITGPVAEGVRGGSITSGGLVPKAEPAASVKPNTWSAFVVRN